MPVECNEHSWFDACIRGDVCRFEHKSTPSEQDFFITRIVSMKKYKNGVSVEVDRGEFKTLYWLIDNSYNTKEAKEENIVVFQASKTKYETVLRGRILNIISENLNFDYREDLKPIKGAFTLDPPGTRLYDDAFSIEECKKCKEKNFSGWKKVGKCNKIGIHVAAPSLTKLSLQNINSYSSRPANHDEKGLEEKRYKLVISVFLHTKNNSMSGPEISVIKIDKNYYISDDKDSYRQQIKYLLMHFKDLLYIENALATRYSLNQPNSWKDSFVVEKAMASFNSVFTEFITKSEWKVYFITETDGAKETVYPKNIVISEALYENARKKISTTEKSCGDTNEVFALVAACERYSHMKTIETSGSFSDKYERSVQNSLELKLDEKKIVKSTSPLRNTHHYLNLQIFIHRFLTKTDALFYKKGEVLGILGIRYKEPKIYHAIVTKLNQTGFVTKYSVGYNANTCEIKWKMFSRWYDSPDEGSTVVLKNISCKKENYCDGKMIAIDSEVYKKLLHELRGDQKPKVMKTLVCEMKKGDKTPQERTYSKPDNDTKLEIRTTSVLQLQISADDENKKNNLGLRLLRVGIDCHYCFLHINQPGLAFMSDRKDIHDLDLGTKIKNFKDATSVRTQFIEVYKITWLNYLSGGSFNKKCESSKGDLLCIRKEVYNKGGDIKYVWNAHAIVSGSSEGKIDFLICTLSQAEAPSNEKNFCIDIFKTGEKQSL